MISYSFSSFRHGSYLCARQRFNILLNQYLNMNWACQNRQKKHPKMTWKNFSQIILQFKEMSKLRLYFIIKKMRFRVPLKGIEKLIILTRYEDKLLCLFQFCLNFNKANLFINMKPNRDTKGSWVSHPPLSMQNEVIIEFLLLLDKSKGNLHPRQILRTLHTAKKRPRTYLHVQKWAEVLRQKLK